MRHTVRQFADAIASVSRQRWHAPCFREFLAAEIIFNVLIARISIRQCAHIAGALNVVLTTNRVNTDVRFTQVASHQRKACQRANSFHALIELGHAHAPQNRGGFRLRIHACSAANFRRSNASNFFNRFRRVASNNFAILVETFGTFGHE
ncbi:hypothetical protein D3C75_838060 [compost metagenome]